MNILIAIESCKEHKDRVAAQRDTWAKGSNIIAFDGESLDVPDDYNSLPQKTQAICRWAFLNEIDYLFKIDTDTYVNVERLLASGFENYDYTGYVLDWLEVPYCSGPAYWLSRKAFEIVANADLSQFRDPSYPNAEDVIVGRILKAAGILPFHDRRYALYEDVLPGNDVISSHLSSRQAYQIEFMYQAHKKAHDPDYRT